MVQHNIEPSTELALEQPYSALLGRTPPPMRRTRLHLLQKNSTLISLFQYTNSNGCQVHSRIAPVVQFPETPDCSKIASELPLDLLFFRYAFLQRFYRSDPNEFCYYFN